MRFRRRPVCFQYLSVSWEPQTNSQGAIVRKAGGRFLHIELSEEVRRKLCNQRTAVNEFLKCLPLDAERAE